MKQSQLFYKSFKEAPSDEISQNAILLTRAGFIDKLGAGIYSFLPLGLRSLNKIENIIRQEMDAVGGQEILMPALHPKENWQQTGRWENFDALFRLKGPEDRDYALGATHEEIVVPLAKGLISSYKDLPLYLFQIQTKFRKEARAKSGLLRTREFRMKDLYSFHADQDDLDAYYEKAKEAYFKIYERCGLDEKTYLTLASGGTFSKYSHEFQTLAESGEDIIYICQNCDLAINHEIKQEHLICPECGGNEFKKEKAIEVGNIFKLGNKYSDPFGLKFKDKEGNENTVIMGCYGIGPTRILGTIAEISHDERGLIWPAEVSPFSIHLLVLGEGEKTRKNAEELYEKLIAEGADVLYDDRDISAGQKLVEADLIGIPTRIVVSEKTLAKKSAEIKNRTEEKTELVPISSIFDFLP
ncbi:MAG: His/Gly/Thr/Pro-type tRNA ligase C-terminal domain-containing protein [Candidatus Portnoybacteria bacterium]|nr:His/Gly/Thr/Pro-type tRNA ligase C-terminal domain-containing protein [Candidatus Portnoybacteria bacterium]